MDENKFIDRSSLNANLSGGSLETPLANTSVFSAPETEPYNAPRYSTSHLRFNRRAVLITAGIGTLVGVVLIGLLGLFLTKNNNNLNKVDNSIGSYASTASPLKSANGAAQLSVGNAQTLAVNGQLLVNKTLVLTPSRTPTTATPGELYYDSATNTPYFYNGSTYVSLTPSALPTHVTSVGGVSGVLALGSSLTVSGDQLSVAANLLQAVNSNSQSSRVSTIQGQSGNVSFTAGNGISINGTTISSTAIQSLQAGNGISVSGNQIINSGVVALTSTGNSIKITPEGNGVFDLENANGGGSGVASLSSNNSSLSITNDGEGDYNAQIAPTGVSAGSYGSASTAAIFTINAGGQLTGVSTVPIAINGNQITSGTISTNYLSSDVALYDRATSNFSGNLEQDGYSVCTTSENCVGVPGGSIGGSGTSGTISMFTGLGYTIGNSALNQVSGNLVDGGNLSIQGSGGLILGSGSATATIKAASSGTPTFTLPANTGSSGQCLATDGTGILSFTNCLSGSSSGSAGVSSLNGLSGSLSLTQGTGVLVSTGSSTISIGLGTTGVTMGTYGSAADVATFTVNSEGQLTASSSVPIAINGDQITSGTVSDGYLENDVALYDSATSNFTGTLQQGGDDVCTTAGNCIGSPGESIGGGGSTGTLPVFTGSGYTIGNSVLSQSDGDLTDTGYLAVEGSGGLIIGSGTATATLKSGSVSPVTFTLPDSEGTSGQCLTTDGSSDGVLSFEDCVTGGGGSGVSTLNGLSGALDITQGSSVSVTTGSNSISIGLASSGVTADSYGSASEVATFTVNGEGQIISANSTPISIDGDQITSGTVGDSFLSSNVALYDNTTSNFTGDLEQGGNDVCTTAGNCTGVAGGSLGGSGSAGTLAVFTGSGYSLGNSALTEASGNLTASGNLVVQGTNGLTLGSGTATTTILGSSSSAITFTLPSGTGSSGQCLTTDGSGVLSFADCLSGSSGGSGGVTSLDSLSGSVGLQDSSGELKFTNSGQNINIALPQDLGMASGPTFDSLTLTNPLTISNGGTGQNSAPSSGELLIGTSSGTYGLSTLTGDTGVNVTNTSGSITLGLSTTTVAAGSYGDDADVASFTVNAEGQLTSASAIPIAINGNQITSGTISNNRLNSDVALYDNVTSNFTGDLQQGGNDVCTIAGNCVGVSGGAIGGSGSASTIALFTGSGYTIGNSALIQTGGNLADSGDLTVQGNGGLILGSGSDTTSLLSGSSSALSFTLPTSVGSAGQCLTTGGSGGVLSFADCLSGSSGGSGGVISLNGLSGSVNIDQGTGLTVGTSSNNVDIGLSDTAVVAGSYGDDADVASFTVNSQGQLTTASNIAIAINGNQITSGTIGNNYLSSDVALYDNVTSNFSGDLQQGGSDVCTIAGNCVGVSGGAIGGSGSAGTIALFTGSGYTIGNSALSQTAGNLIDNGNLNIQGADGLTLGSGSDTTALISGSSSAISFTLPSTVGSSGQCLTTGGSGGVLSFTNCLSGGSGGSGGVASLNNLSGSVTLEDTSGTLTFSNSDQNIGITLAATTVSPNNYGDPADVATFTVNSTGQLIAAGSTPIEINGDQITSGSVAVAQGGTGITSYTQGSLIYASGATTLNQLADGTSGECLTGTGPTSAPTWGSCGNGLTGSGISGQIALFNGTNSLTGSVLTQTSGNLTSTGNLLVETGTNSVTAFQVQNASSATVLTVNTTTQNVTVGTTATSSGNPFSATNTQSLTTGTNPDGVTSGNFCNNGLTDLAVTNYGSATTSIYCNTSSLTTPYPLTATISLTTGTDPDSVTSGNFCNNGLTDLAVTNYGSATTSIYCNTGSTGSAAFSSTATTSLTTGTDPEGIATGNLCNNSRFDLAVTNYGSATTSVYCNTGSTGSAAFSATATTSLTTGTDPEGIVSGNLCNNSRSDIAVTNFGSNTASIYCNTGSTGAAAFSTTASRSPTTGTGPTAIVTANLCNNTRADLAVINYTSSTASIYCNTGSTGSAAFSTTATVSPTTGTNPEGVTTGNLCGNGWKDLGVTNYSSNTASIYCNTGSTGAAAFSTTASSSLITGANPEGITTGNLCNVSRADLAVTNYGSGTAYISCNQIVVGGVATGSLQVSSAITSNIGILVQGAASQTADLLDAYTSNNVLLDSINASGDLCVAQGNSCSSSEALQVNGNTLLQTPVDSTSAFEIQDTSSDTVLKVDTVDDWVGINDANPSAALDVQDSSPAFFDGFETGTLAPFTASNTGDDGCNTGWHIISTDAYDGLYEAQAINTASYALCTLSISQTLSAAGTVSFWLYCKTGDGATTFNVDSTSQTINCSKTGTADTYNFPVTSGTHKFTWQINEPAGLGGNNDEMEVDDIKITNVGNGTAALFSGGDVGIGTTFPANLLSVGALTTASAGAQIAVSTGGATNSGIVVQDVAGQSAGYAFQLQNSAGTSLASVDYEGNLAVQNVTAVGTLTVNTAKLAATVPATATTNLTTAASPYDITTGNLCNNGLADLAVPNHGSTSVSIYCNTGSTGSAAFSTTATMTLTTGTDPEAVTTGNFCNNALTDLAVANYGSTTTSIYCNTGSTGSAAFSTTATMTLTTGTDPDKVTTGNLCNNGLADLAVANYGSATTSIYCNTGSTGSAAFSTTATTSLTTGTDPWGITSGNLCGTSRTDLAVTNRGSNTASVYCNTDLTGSAAFSSTATKSLTTGVDPQGITTGNFCGNGRADLAVANYSANTASVYCNTGLTGSSVFSSAATTTLTTGSNPENITTGNFCGSGRADLAITNYGANTASVYCNTGSATSAAFSTTATITLTTGSDPQGITTGNFCGNGLSDLAITNYGANTASVYCNTSSSSQAADFINIASNVGTVLDSVNSNGDMCILTASCAANGASLQVGATVLFQAAAITNAAFSTTSSATLTTGTDPYKVTTGNLCNNGLTDLAVANYGSASVSIYCNTGFTDNPAFSSTATTTLTTGSDPDTIAVGNLCNNGLTDLAVTNRGSTSVSIYCNTGSTGSAAFSSTATTTLTTGSDPDTIAVGNLCNNGLTDLAITNYGATTASVYCNTGSTGSAAFSSTATKSLTTGSDPWGITTGNLCNNGLTDLAITNYGANTASVYCNTGSTGSAAFSSTATKSLTTGSDPVSIITGNVCNTGKADLVINDYNSTSVSIYCNTGSTGSAAFSTTATTSLTTGTDPWGITSGNLCGNGLNDLAVTNYGSTSISIYCNTNSTGSAAFSSIAADTLTTGSDPQGITTGNFCGNGLSDLAVVNENASSTYIYCNIGVHSGSTTAFQVQSLYQTDVLDVDTVNGRVGINTNAPGNLLSIGALTTAAGTYQIAVSTGGATNSGIVVQTVASQSSGYVFQAQNSTGSTLASIDYLGNLTVQNATITGVLTINGHIVTANSSGSTTAAVQTNAGTGATCSVSGDDTSGQITLTTGTSAWASGAQCILTFGSSYASAPHPVLTPVGTTNPASVIPTVSSTPTTFSVNFINADTAQNTYTWDYFNAQ